jgi:hypothetical protein
MNGGGGSFDDPQQLEGENHGEDDFGITACMAGLLAAQTRSFRVVQNVQQE